MGWIIELGSGHDQRQQVYDPPRSTVAIAERMDRLKPIVLNRQPDERIDVILRLDAGLAMGAQIADRLFSLKSRNFFAQFSPWKISNLLSIAYGILSPIKRLWTIRMDQQSASSTTPWSPTRGADPTESNKCLI
jgi:hypothetical protein